MTYQFQIQIKGVTQPPVWRQLLVPANFNFLQFHQLIQSSFGWKGHHLFHFAARSYDSYQIGINRDDFGYDVAEADTVLLSEIFTGSRDKYVYVYDFGDDWIHLIKLEKVIDEKTSVAQCIAGKGGCPPEDCGGPAGYDEVKKSLKFSGNARLDELRKWLYKTNGGKFDINAFDIEKVNQLLSKI